MILAIDFDSTVHDDKHPAPGRKMGPPIVGAKEALTQFKAQGHTIIIHTAQTSFKHIEDWLHYFDIPFDEVTNIKPLAACYIDDKAVHFTAWKNINIHQTEL